MGRTAVTMDDFRLYKSQLHGSISRLEQFDRTFEPDIGISSRS